MHQVLWDCLADFCVVYLDDITVHSSSIEDHARHLDMVLSRLKEAGFRINLAKCRFAQSEVRFLGHVVSAQGIKPDPDLVASVQDWPTPPHITHVRGFLSLCSFMRCFVRKFTDIARPLINK